MKLLVLDDLLISLDMSNRMQVIKIILSDEDFADYNHALVEVEDGEILVMHNASFDTAVLCRNGIFFPFRLKTVVLSCNSVTTTSVF